MGITDPRHSRPIDVHRWSDHPEVNDIVDALWREHFADFQLKTSGPKPKARIRDQLKVLVLDLYVAWASDPKLSIGVPMSVGAWNTSSRYNALHISKMIIPIVHRLHEAGLIDFALGSYSGPGAASNRNTRIRAAEPLAAMFGKARFEVADVEVAEGRETVILRDDDGPDGKSRPIEYEETPRTIRMREDLAAYNDLLSRCFIDLPHLERPYVEREITEGPRAGKVQRVPIGPSNSLVRRVFSRGRWDLNGRFYGGWWQQIDKATRNLIRIDNAPTVEIDFRGLHVAILSKEKGYPLTGDPYQVRPNVLEDVGEWEQRELLKRLVLTAINAKSIKVAYKAFRDGYAQGTRGKSLKDNELERLLYAFVEKHPHLEDTLGSDQGIRLMYEDSRIAEKIINHFTTEEIPVLCIHDSFIIDHRMSLRLKQMMKEATAHLFGGSLGISQDYPGIDEFLSNPNNTLSQYINFRDLPTFCRGYLHRQEQFRRRRERKIREKIIVDYQEPA